ncbi:MAG: RluA family pseudouridine synthase [Chloroflexota bacterium]
MSQQQITFAVEKPGERLDKLVLSRVEGLSRTQIQAMIKDGHVTVDGRQVKAGVKLNGGEQIAVTLPAEEATELEAEDIPLTYIYEDEHLAVIEKPAGLVVHPGVGNESGTLVNALLAKYPHLMETERKGIVHRLDKDTSGLIVVGLHEDAIEDLMAQFKERVVDKTYLAFTEKSPPTLTGTIDAPIGRDPKQRKRMAVVRDGKPALTEFEVIEQEFAGEQALVKCKIHTGRTHQIRVHLAFVNAPVVGDTVYGYRKQRVGLKRLFLHAAQLQFEHPVTEETMTFESPLPANLQNILEKLRK